MSVAPRIIVGIVLDGYRAVKTKGYENYKYLGDPVNLVRIYSGLGAAEIQIIQKSKKFSLDDDAYTKFLGFLAEQSRMSISYGGNIKTIKHAEKIISLGYERVILSTALFREHRLFKTVSEVFGSQAVVLKCVFNSEASDVTKKLFNTGSGKLETYEASLIQEVSEHVGEIALEDCLRDGSGIGIDLLMVTAILQSIKVSNPLILSGGFSGDVDEFRNIIRECPSVRALVSSRACSLYGKYDAPLPQYPYPLMIS
jgi:cyclase